MIDGEYRTGWPKERGLYKCKVDGKEKYLVHHTCDLNGRHWWTDTRGFDVVGCKVEWLDKKLTVDDIG